MEKLKEIQLLANELINTTFTINTITGDTKEVNIGEIGYKLVFDSRPIRRAGQCRYTKKEIGLSTKIILANIDRIDSIDDTIRHEIAHAISNHIYGKEGRGHGKHWENTAVQVGAKPNKCWSSDKYTQPLMKYTLTCPSCGKTAGQARKTKYNYSCRPCSGGTYNEEFKLIVTKNY